jgi:AraC-like DNA-binding protein
MGDEVIVPFSHAIYARRVLDCLTGRGISPSTVLTAAGLHWQDVCHGRSIDLAAFRRFIEQAVAQSGEPALGLIAGSMLQPYHSHVGIAVATSPTLADGLEFLCRHAHLVFGDVNFYLGRGPRFSSLNVIPSRLLHGLQIFISQFIVAAHCRLLEAMLGRNVDELTVHLPFTAPGDHGARDSHFVRRVEYGREHLTFLLPTELMQVPCVSANASEHRHAALACMQMQIESGRCEFEQRVRGILLERLTTDPGSLASRLGVSAQTMARRLSEVGVTYSSLKDELRNAQAVWYLQHTDLSIESVARELGYSDPTNFSRAFKRWHGISPRSMRRSVRMGWQGDHHQPSG